MNHLINVIIKKNCMKKSSRTFIEKDEHFFGEKCKKKWQENLQIGDQVFNKKKKTEKKNN